MGLFDDKTKEEEAVTTTEEADAQAAKEKAEKEKAEKEAAEKAALKKKAKKEAKKEKPASSNKELDLKWLAFARRMGYSGRPRPEGWGE